MREEPLSITSQGFLVTVTVLALGALAMSVVAARHRPRRLALAAAATMVLVVGADVWVRTDDPFHSSLPVSFTAWVGVAVLAVAVAVLEWRRADMRRRV